MRWLATLRVKQLVPRAGEVMAGQTETFRVERERVLVFQVAAETARASAAEAELAKLRNENAQRTFLEISKSFEAFVTEDGRYEIVGPLRAVECTVDRRLVESP